MSVNPSLYAARARPAAPAAAVVIPRGTAAAPVRQRLDVGVAAAARVAAPRVEQRRVMLMRAATVKCIGDVQHPVARAVRKLLPPLPLVSVDVIIHFCLVSDDGAFTTVALEIEKLWKRLCVCAQNRTRYVLVVADNAAPLLAGLVARGIRELDVNGCVLDIGTVFGDGAPSVVDDILDAVAHRVPIPVLSSAKAFRFVHFEVAVEAVLRYATRAAETGVLLVQEGDGTRMCHSELASRIALKWSPKRAVHLKFIEEGEGEGEAGAGQTDFIL